MNTAAFASHSWQGMSREAARPIVHLELHTRDAGGACAFYAQTCGWQPQRIGAAGRTYLALETGTGVGGGVVECETHRALWLPYVEVPEIAAATERARELGAQVLLEPREGPAGWRSVVAAPAGGEIAFWQAKCYTK
jgi:predicted enzyme related to lactoylglutathione lyase